MADNHSKEVRSYNMSKIRSVDTTRKRKKKKRKKIKTKKKIQNIKIDKQYS